MTPNQFGRRSMLGLVAGIALLGATGARAQVLGISGSYRVEGRNPDGSTYSGSLTLVNAGGKVGMIWKVGSQTYEGHGVLDGRVLTVDWGSDAPVVYVVMPNGMLHGTWANGTALERLIPTS